MMSMGLEQRVLHTSWTAQALEPRRNLTALERHMKLRVQVQRVHRRNWREEHHTMGTVLKVWALRKRWKGR